MAYCGFCKEKGRLIVTVASTTHESHWDLCEYHAAVCYFNGFVVLWDGGSLMTEEEAVRIRKSVREDRSLGAAG